MSLMSLTVGLRFATGLVLLVSGATKLRAPRAFAAGVAAYRLVPPWLTRATAAAVIIGEVAAAVALLSGVAVLAGGLIALALGLVFTAAVGTNLWRRASILCHC